MEAALMSLVTNALSDDDFDLDPVVLHELLHTQGRDYVYGDPENLMSGDDEAEVFGTPYSDQETL